MGNFTSNTLSPHFSLSFYCQIGEKTFPFKWWAQGENSFTPIFYPLSPPQPNTLLSHFL